MSEVGAADRSRLLRSKRAEIEVIVKSRKRKLRELFAVCDSEIDPSQITYSDPNAPSTYAAESHFLDVSDITRDQIFDENNLPPRRNFFPDASTQLLPVAKASAGTTLRDGSWKKADGLKARASKGSPSSGMKAATVPVTNSSESSGDRKGGPSSPVQQPTTTRPHDDSLEAGPSLPKETGNQALGVEDIHGPQEPAFTKSDANGGAESTTSRSRSPGVDPRKVMPILAEDASNLNEPLLDGLGSHDGLHKAKTVHLPSKEVQEGHLRQAKSARGHLKDHAVHLSINLPPRDGGRSMDPLSSPGSTVDARSATTPALHEASTDTSPDNETSRYDAEPLKHKDKDGQTPQGLRPSPQAIHEKEEHDRLLRAQIDASREAILGSSPTAADAQLRMEEKAASYHDDRIRQQESAETVTADAADAQVGLDAHHQPDSFTRRAQHLVQDLVEDGEQDGKQDVQMTIDDDITRTNMALPPKDSEDHRKHKEIADSEGESEAGSGEPMFVDKDTSRHLIGNRREVEGKATSMVDAENLADAILDLPSDQQVASSNPQPPAPRRRSPSSSAAAPRPLDRMTTRVSSGAMRHKSVSEILGEIPRPNTVSSPDRSAARGASEYDSLRSSGEVSRRGTPLLSGSRARSLADRAKEKEGSKLSMVVFAKQATRPHPHNTAVVPRRSQIPQSSEDDYFYPLFLATTATEKRGVQPVENLLQTAHKTVTTTNTYVPIKENQAQRVLKRIYNLQSSNKWSLRQPRRAAEPVRPTSHWDILLQEAKWMRTDFKEEKKWKMTAARNLALACAEWNETSPEDRKLLQVNSLPPKHPEPSTSQEVEAGNSIHGDAMKSSSLDVLDEVAAEELMDDFDEEPRLNLDETVPPTAIFALHDDEVVFGLRLSPATDKLLQELPMYGTPLNVPQSDFPNADPDPDRLWRREALPLSRFVEGRIELKFNGPPRKRSRYEYEDEDEDSLFGESFEKRPTLTPEKTEVALFNPEHKHIRDRIHASHQFRPPSEYQMPLQSFFECRSSSQWTWAEDDELKGFVREYSYNWSLISSMLSSRSMFSSGAERRTPWECFERWIHLEGLPADMQKTQYFRAYTSRLEAANRNVIAQAAQASQQLGPNGQVQPPRRRTTSSVRVERRRSQKHLTLVDAMRKLAKKRETNQQKQQHVAGLAAMRKANEVQQQRAILHTPQDFSRLRQERDDQMRERLVQLQQRQEQQRRAAMMQARNASQNPQQLGLPPNMAQPRVPVPPTGPLVSNATPNSNGQNLTVPGQNRPRPMAPLPGQLPMPNLRAPLQVNGVQPLSMQNPVAGQLLPDLGLVTQAHQISQQQRQAIQMRHQNQVQGQMHGQMQGQSSQIHTSPPRVNGMPQAGFNIPPNMMPPYNTAHGGVSTPPPNGLIHSPSPGQAGSPRMGQQPRVSNHIQAAHIEQQIKEKYPNATTEQVTRLVSETLAKSVHQRQGLAQSAMNAAAGGSGIGGSQGHQRMPSGVESSPQLYAQMLRQQQENQQKAAQQQAASAAAVANGNGQGNGNAGHAHRRSSSSLPGNLPPP